MIELAAGNEQQIDQALALIKTHKLYKRGLIVFDKREQLRQIKEIMINDLLAAGQSNQAYRMCQSIKNYRRALEIAIEGFDGKKIKECLDSLYDNCQERK